MFRAAVPGPFDEPVARATDENLTSEDWGAIMEVCDKVTSDPNGAKEAVQSLIKRLAHRNANVQLYTLELANSLAENCGKPIHRELASRAFTDALLKLAGDRNTHQQVKSKILERMKHWSDMFSNDVDLGVMSEAYHRLKASNPGLQPPSAPQKNVLTDLDRQKEEEELQMALKLSLQEEDRKKKRQAAAAAPGPSAAGPSGTQASGGDSAPHQPVSSGTTAATVSRVRALYDFVPSEPGELEFRKGDVIAVLESVYKDWWRGSLKGKTGIFPLNYVEKLTDPTPEELAREAQMEAEVFAEIKNVEKLLTLLSTSSTSAREEDNEEISKLYHQTLAIRPKLIKLIEKYSQKKDDFTQLNEKFIKARRDYEALLESSMAHRPQPNYHQYAPRPPVPYGGGPGGYPQQMPPPQDPQRYYTPAPQQADQGQYVPSSPSPNFQRPPPGGVAAPFYVAGAEVPPASGYPPRDQPPRGPSGGPMPAATPVGGRPQQQQPAPINTSAPAPAAGYMAYGQAPVGSQPQQPPPQQGGGRPQSTYGNAQELATSVYDSPIAPNHPQSAATYSSSVYSQDDPYVTSPAAGAPPPAQSMYTQLPQPSGPSAPPSDAYDGYDAGVQPSGPMGSAPPPSQPTSAPPPVPGSAAARPQPGLAPAPLQPSGPAYDARNTLPSQQRTYNAYVPPGQGQASGPPDVGMGMPPSAPPAGGAEGYYRTQGQTLY